MICLDETGDNVIGKAAFSIVSLTARDELVEVRLQAATPTLDAFMMGL
jgi:hypothetical protein